ncbi:DEAD/DEAH box helicase [Pseudomonas sp. EpS/L25]|uniref:DEAD/DEAH box helicase n=1 Tax=Pseudomonas sp. EpS/L25 TaxID=1749078 RepID=UPI000743F077|nr:DEAD/DEAH box helicase [Pseudomonas sp. EpS/L25]KUM43713.1 helicase [Pseudomonas sp. EpS/L25]
MRQPSLRNAAGTSQLLQRAVCDGYDFGLKMPYIEGANRLLTARGGSFIRRGEHPLWRFWRVPQRRLLDDLEVLFHQLVELADGRFAQDWSVFSRKIADAQADVRRDLFIWGMRLRIAPLSGGGVVLSGDYHPGCVAVAKRMRGAFLSSSRAWRVPASAELLRSNLILELGLLEEQFEMLDVLQELLSDGSISTARDVTSMSIGGPPQERASCSVEEGSEADVYLAAVPDITTTSWTLEAIDAELKPFSLMSHQPAGIRHLLQRTSALLADDMGLGKSRQAVIAAGIQSAGRPILVVVLASLVINWEREIQAVYPDARIARQRYLADAQWVIVNYERLGDFVAIAGQFAVMIVDEAHRLKEPTAAWTRNGFDIAAKVPNRYLLTGTPVLNRESELHTLLRLSGHPIGQLPLKDFCERFAGSPEFRQALRAEICDWMLRRRKDVLPDLKGKQQQTVPVVLDERQQHEYNAIRTADRPVFARLGQLRQLLERVKVPVVMELLTELEPDDKAILFCEYKETVATLQALCAAAGICCVTLVGTDSVTKRQKAIDHFQQDADCRVFICTTSAAGTGNNLTAANYVFFLGLPWTPGQQDQAEDRAYRNGQQRLVVVKIPLVENSIDLQLWQMLQDKRRIASDLIEPDAIKRVQSELAGSFS